MGTRNWREVRGERALNAVRVETFRQLMAAQQRVAEALEPVGVTEAQLAAALEAAESELPRDERDERDFFAPALERYVTALGGRLELGADRSSMVATFPQVSCTIDRDLTP